MNNIDDLVKSAADMAMFDAYKEAMDKTRDLARNVEARCSNVKPRREPEPQPAPAEDNKEEDTGKNEKENGNGTEE